MTIAASTNKRVLPDLLAQAKAAELAAQQQPVAKPAMTGSPYEAPAMGGFVASKGKNAGKYQHRLIFKHKANPVWSRQYDLTDLELILGNLELARGAMVALKKLKG